MLGATWALLRRRPLGLLAGAIGMAALDSVLDIVAPDSGATFISNIASIAVIYVIFRALLRDEDMIEHEGSFGSYFGVSMLTGLGMIVGLLLLVVPGLYLMGRWSLASAMVIAKGMKTTEAMRASWEASEHCVWKLVAVYTLWFGVFFAAVLVLGAGAGFAAVTAGGDADVVDSSPVFIIALNLAVNLGVVASAYLNVAVFQQVVGGDKAFREVFA